MARLASSATIGLAIIAYRLMYRDGENMLPWVGAWVALSLVLIIASRRRVAFAVCALAMLGAEVALFASKERLRTNGVLVFLPLDSLDTQAFTREGDYRALRLTLSKQLERDVPQKAEGERAFVWVTLDDQHIATGSPTPTALRIRYLLRDGRIWLGTDASFGTGDASRHFEQARFGAFRVDPETGEALFVGLRDAELHSL